VTPAAYEIASLDVLDHETFGPILHVVRYDQGRLADVIEAINASGYGLTLGLHSRVASVADYVAEHARVGNLYVNRNQIGAVVGVQPFGGEGLSGTGPKAGGPNYLTRFATERVRTDDITATGGNTKLLGLSDR
jgi:RHH-type proline utilization regulon transcriptional repressor/proline dehydrogenase/delta 1-pyrroline-5-carboxylate dehydrogenase